MAEPSIKKYSPSIRRHPDPATTRICGFVRRLVARRMVFGIAVGWILLVVAAATLSAQSRTVRRVGIGVRLIKIQKPEIPLAIQVLEVALRDNDLALETSKARDRLVGRETTSSMAARSDRNGHRVVGAVNGDFFEEDGQPINLQIRNGEIVRAPTARSELAVDAHGGVHIDIFTLNARLTTAKGLRAAIDNLNTPRLKDNLIFYNRYAGKSTGTNIYGTEARLRPLHAAAVNVPLPMVVTEMRSGGPAMTLDTLSSVLSGHGAASDFLRHNLAVGDSVTLFFQLTPGADHFRQSLGGLPRLLRNSEAVVAWQVEGASLNFAFDRHPRTALGYNAAGDTLYLVTVDGRQEGYSVGMSLFELTRFLKELGCTEAINLDGGGSTTMVVRGELINRPSDANGERPVGNALLVVSQASPAALCHLEIEPDSLDVLQGELIAFTYALTDSFYNPVPTVDLDWSTSNGLGQVTEAGVFTAGETAGRLAVYAAHGELRDSVIVRIHRISGLTTEPREISLAIGDRLTLRIFAVDEMGKRYPIAADQANIDVHAPVTAIHGETVQGLSAGDGNIKIDFRGSQVVVPVHVTPATGEHPDDKDERGGAE